MSAKLSQRNRRKATARRWPKPVVRGLTMMFADGSALILDGHAGIIGLIEARTPYRVWKRTKPRPLANSHR